MLRHDRHSDISIGGETESTLLHCRRLFRGGFERDAAPGLTPPKKEKNAEFISDLNNNLIDLI